MMWSTVHKTLANKELYVGLVVGLLLGLVIAWAVPWTAGTLGGLDCKTIWSVVIGTVAGGIISVVVGGAIGYLFYKQSGDELKAEAAKLRRCSEVLLAMIPPPPHGRLHRDEDGLPALEAFVSGEAPILSIKAPPGVAVAGAPGPPPTYDRQHENPEIDAGQEPGPSLDQR